MNRSQILFLTLIFFFSFSFSQVVHVVQTAKNTGDRLTPKADISFQTKKTSNTTITISDAKTYQKIYGFGGAFTEAAAVNWNQLNETLQQQILREYFSNLNYRVGRVHINSCDFCESSYSFDNIPGDYELTNFSLKNGHDLHTVIPMIKAALQIAGPDFRLFGSPWSPPFWMKSNGQMDGSNRPGLIQDPSVFRAWALYFSKWISAYKAEDIPIWGITIQNEPEFAAPWEACCYTADQEADFLAQYLGPQMKQDHPEVKIMIYDHNKDDVYAYASEILGKRLDAARYVDGVAFHWYSGPQFENVLEVHEHYPDYFLLATEACVCPGDQGFLWESGEKYGYDILGDLNSWAVGWVDWNMCLDMQGGPNHLQGYCGSPVMINQTSKNIFYNPSFYYMGQISKFILPDSLRIDYSISGDLDISLATFKTPSNSIVTVVMNSNDSPVDFDIEFNGKFAYYELPEHSIATFYFDK